MTIKRITAFILSAFVLANLSLQPVLAENTDDAQKKELEQKIQLYQSKLNEARSQKNTLSSQIQYMDAKIYLTGLQITETEKKIVTTQQEIEKLSTKIEGLDTSLDYLSKLLLQRVVASYKERQTSIFDVVLNSQKATTALSGLQYMRTAQDNNQKLLMHVQEAKLNFEEQKSLREKKKQELANLSEQLAQQKADLDVQKVNKQRLLEITKNDEATYSKLLADAQKQLAGFKSFVQTAGGGVIPANGFGTGNGGWYYSQRDSRWAGVRMGDSNDSVLEVGCLITDIAMLMKKDGIDMTPADIASNSNYFFSNTAFMLHPSRFSWPNGKSYVNVSVGAIDDELKNGRPVIVGVYHGQYGTHYLILKEQSGSDYIINDPYYGPDKKFSDLYSKSSIFVAAVFK